MENTSERRHRFFPLFVDSLGKKAIVIGGGKIATRRVKTLLKFGFEIEIISPEISEELREMICNARIRQHDETSERSSETREMICGISIKQHDETSETSSETREMICGAHIKLLHERAAAIPQELNEVNCDPRIYWRKETFRSEHLGCADIVLACTADREINREIGRLAREKNILVSVADCKEESSFYFPAIAENQEIIVGLTSDGKDHAKVKKTAQAIREILE